MNVFLLLQELRTLLEASFKTFPFQAHVRGQKEKDNDGEDAVRSPTVFIGSMPQKEGELQEIVPFILIQAMQGFTVDGMHQVDIAFRVCVRNRDAEALENDLHNIIAELRNTLFQIKKQPLLNKVFLLESDKGILPWVRPDEQEDPYAQAFIMGKFEFPTMQ